MLTEDYCLQKLLLNYNAKLLESIGDYTTVDRTGGFHFYVVFAMMLCALKLQGTLITVI